MTLNLMLIATGASALFLGFTHFLFLSEAPIVFSCFLALTACVYGGAALTPSGATYGRVELPVVGVVFFTAILGIIVGPVWLAVGYVIHGAWDILHHNKCVGTPIVSWFPPVCAVFDFIVAGTIYFWWV
ncbi:MAG: hypothetical protein KDD55_05910 [Bdellovibrionales bacterium]|nr:hypothetical protein [Bdellovibrionales bacterium]